MNDLELKFLKDADNSPSSALEMTRHMIAWLEYVADRDYSEDHRQAVIIACQRFYKTIQPIASHYLD